jgi:hypothetical protein
LGGEKRFFCDLGELNPFGKGPESAVDNMKLQIWGSIGGFERAKIRERMGRGMAAKSAQPDTCTRKLPEGVVFKRYNEKVNSGVFGFTEYARTVIVKAFRRAAAGDRLMQIVKDMSAEAEALLGHAIGHSNGYGNFGTKTLRDTLQSRWWLCEKPGNVKANFGAWHDEEHGNITAEPIFTESLWLQVQDRLKRNTDSDSWTKQKPIKGDFLAAGMMFCGKCGSKCTTKTKQMAARERCTRSTFAPIVNVDLAATCHGFRHTVNSQPINS